jgi:D-glycero-alpha-D-manno-heptose-7-phosphate kinase
MIITQTPFRISFFGGGTDYPDYIEKHGGAVLGTASDHSAYLSVARFYSRLFDYSIRIAYRQVESLEEAEGFLLRNFE